MTRLSAIPMRPLSSLLTHPASGGGLQSVLGTLLRGPSTARKGNGSTFPDDTLSLTQPLKALSRSGLDLEKSRFVESAQLLAFNLSYEEESLQQVSLQGYYNFYAEHLTADFSFISAMVIKDPATGEEQQELFRFNLHLEASHTLTHSGSSSIQKEDILQFARKLVTKIAKLYAEGKEIDGLALDSEDLKDLAAVDDGSLLEHIMAIVELMKAVSKLRRDKGEHVWVDLEREKGLVCQESTQEQESLGFSLTVERVQTQGTPEPAPAQEPPAQD